MPGKRYLPLLLLFIFQKKSANAIDMESEHDM